MPMTINQLKRVIRLFVFKVQPLMVLFQIIDSRYTRLPAYDIFHAPERYLVSSAAVSLTVVVKVASRQGDRAIDTVAKGLGALEFIQQEKRNHKKMTSKGHLRQESSDPRGYINGTHHLSYGQVHLMNQGAFTNHVYSTVPHPTASASQKPMFGNNSAPHTMPKEAHDTGAGDLRGDSHIPEESCLVSEAVKTQPRGSKGTPCRSSGSLSSTTNNTHGPLLNEENEIKVRT
ncbi:hypothetical protein O181_076798 [Austropuccinia psidii MF-1]|uniref:Uncharacterized protein n=1 Tax=Austropuccinia psidii MF-1 TaxID=1389203 RepID=A0A9Q3ID53_9BASI|nr:hypothetical protein [Austropuccinia psidii MF-1]